MKITKWISFLFITVALASCYPEKERTTEDFDLIGTRFAEQVDFNTYKTYTLRDSVETIYDTAQDKPEYSVETTNLILSTIKTNLMNNGWVEATAGETPDVYIESSIWGDKIKGAAYYPGWNYYGYMGWSNPEWGTPSLGVSYYSFTTETIMMYMIDVKNYPNDDSAPVIMWAGGLNGVLAATNPKIETAINQAFSQSPYLNLK